jgi:hypothetical protein
LPRIRLAFSKNALQPIFKRRDDRPWAREGYRPR